ncbi:MAG TPA: Gfo/Idh/MocA family oxidoreductase [bacterium]|nr:Gfo/Idh/MocA family oxidoreductase [bacterium]HPN33002.1 Gfo/Idh/MocA family oxidoreductase [bacterium]
MRIRWGILSTAHIAVHRVIAAIQKSQYGEVVAIASRDRHRAKRAAEKLAIAKAYGAYEELLQDPQIDAVYNPLPNHLHLPWTLAAMEQGKHVLIEKPMTCTAAEALQLVQACERWPNLKIMEAFMYRFHPQWDQARKLISQGAIGALRSVHSWFSYFNSNSNDYRHHPEMGGGGLLDVGCYCVSVSRLLFQKEPVRLSAMMELDPRTQVDRYVSALLEFPNGMASFTCATHMAFGQQVLIHGDQAALLVETPFIPPAERPARMVLKREKAAEEILVPQADHFTLQADVFNRAIKENAPLPWTAIDAWKNMRVLDAVKQSGGAKAWVEV